MQLKLKLIVMLMLFRYYKDGLCVIFPVFNSEP